MGGGLIPWLGAQQDTSMVGAGGCGAPASLLWDRVRDRERFPSPEVALDREAVRERERRVMQDEATVEKEKNEREAKLDKTLTYYKRQLSRSCIELSQ